MRKKRMAGLRLIRMFSLCLLLKTRRFVADRSAVSQHFVDITASLAPILFMLLCHMQAAFKAVIHLPVPIKTMQIVRSTWLRTNKWKRRPIRSSMPGLTPVGRKLGTNATSHLQQRQVTVPMSIGMAIHTLFRKNGTIRKAVVLLLVRKGHVLADLTQCEIGSGVHRAAVLRQRFPFSSCHAATASLSSAARMERRK